MIRHNVIFEFFHHPISAIMFGDAGQKRREKRDYEHMQ